MRGDYSGQAYRPGFSSVCVKSLVHLTGGSSRGHPCDGDGALESSKVQQSQLLITHILLSLATLRFQVTFPILKWHVVKEN